MSMNRIFAVLALLAFFAPALTGCGATSQQSAENGVPAGEASDAVAVNADADLAQPASVANLSKRMNGLRQAVESELVNAYRNQNPAEVNFDSLAGIQNEAFDKIDLMETESAGCSYSMSTLSDHIYVYLSCEDDTHEFEWRPRS